MVKEVTDYESYARPSYISQTQREFISRGYARESPYSLRFSYEPTGEQKEQSRALADEIGLGSAAWCSYSADAARKRSDHMERVAAVLAQNLHVCEYDRDGGVPYGSDWDLLFWCNNFNTTVGGLLSGRDYSYFTLAFNDKHGHERRQRVCDRVMRILELFSGDENLGVAVQYTALTDDAKVKADAALAAPRIAGKPCAYRGMEGRVEQGSEGLYFRKKRSRKRVYRLGDADILALSWRLPA